VPDAAADQTFSLEPASPAVPAAENEHNQDDDAQSSKKLAFLWFCSGPSRRVSHMGYLGQTGCDWAHRRRRHSTPGPETLQGRASRL